MKILGLEASLEPLTISTACSVNTFARRPPLASTLSFWEWGAPLTALMVWSLLRNLSLDPQRATKLDVKLHAHSVQCAHKLASTRCALEKTFATYHHTDQEKGTASHPPDPH